MDISEAIHDFKVGAKRNIDKILSGIFGKKKAVVIEDAFTAGIHNILRKLPSEVLPIIEAAAHAAMEAVSSGKSSIITATVAAATPEIKKLGIAVEADVIDNIHTTARIVVEGLQAAKDAGASTAPVVA